MEPQEVSVPGQLTFLQSVSLRIVGSLEKFFYHWGYNIATRPFVHIIACVTITIICGIGLLTFTPENRPDKLWIPWNSEFVRDTEWLNKNFPSPFRFHYAIITAEDVLQPEILSVMLDIHNKVKDLKSPIYQYTWEDLCFRLPVIKFENTGRRKRRQVSRNSTNFGSSFDDFDVGFDESEEDKEDKPFDPSVSLPVDIYCSIVDSLDQQCYESNMLELWSYNASVIKTLSREKILEVMNNEQISPVFGRPVNYSMELGLVQRNETGHIVGAQAVMIRWFARLNRTAMNNGDVLTDEGTGQAVDKFNFIWEKELTTFFQNYKPSIEGVTVYYNIARSFADISGSTIWNDAYKLAAGFSIVFMYVIFMLGKFNFVEQRPWLSLAGLSCVGLAIVCSYGICSAFRIIYGPVHNILPFLLLGIGIDDMFVIMQNWNNLSPHDSKKSLPEKLGLTLKHAGVSITTTSLTDFFAFAIGGTTVLPALQSFCIYAALGILATYIFQATFFTAWLAIDQKRIEQRRNAFFPCVVHPAFSPKTWKTKSIAQNFIQKVYCKYLFKTYTKVFVFVLTLAMMGVNIWGNVLLRQEFNPIWFLPQDSYLFQYFAAREQYFPDKGEEGFVMMHNVDLKSNLPTVERLMSELENTSYIHELDAWYPNFKKYVNSNFGKDIPNADLTEKEFRKYLGKFLFSPSGGKYQGSFKFEGNLTCGRPAPVATVSSMNFKFNLFSGPEEHIPAMRKIKGAIRNANFTPEKSHGFIWSFAFAGWETDEIITEELYRNMGLAMICVFLTTLILIANFRTCMMVLLCVVLTLCNVGGTMHFWNLTIDTVSCIDLVLAIGLCVDYAAHIGHAFMTCVGTREERAKKALVNIALAIVHGGFSTFLAFILLANSRSHVFTTFFKIFFLVVAYGLYHGLVFLPVLLSILGPEPYATAIASEKLENNLNNVPCRKEVQMLLVSNSRVEGSNEDRLLSNETPGINENEDGNTEAERK